MNSEDLKLIAIALIAALVVGVALFSPLMQIPFCH